MIGALRAARSASSTVSVDLRPLAVAAAPTRSRSRCGPARPSARSSRHYKVGRGDALQRIGASLADAADKAAVSLTVKKKHGRKWNKYASAKVVLNNEEALKGIERLPINRGN